MVYCAIFIVVYYLLITNKFVEFLSVFWRLVIKYTIWLYSCNWFMHMWCPCAVNSGVCAHASRYSIEGTFGGTNFSKFI